MDDKRHRNALLICLRVQNRCSFMNVVLIKGAQKKNIEISNLQRHLVAEPVLSVVEFRVTLAHLFRSK